MNIVVLTPDYPDDKREAFSFVKQLVNEIANQGNTVQVIAPYSLTHNRRLYKKKEVTSIGQGTITIFRPRYSSFSNIHIGSFYLSSWCLNRAFQRGLKMLEQEPDIVYGHFWHSAYQGYHYAKKRHLPLFVATGESGIEFACDNEDKQDFCDYISGVICVSTKNQEESIKKQLTTKDKCVIIPNAIDSKLFKKIDKTACRKKLGLPINAFIVAFVGWFVERKGANRVSKAISTIAGGDAIYSVFIGDGDAKPLCDNILFKGRLLHEEIPEYLNASDIFVLPTLQEGCCNAVIEAMACGLPIISSNLPFNWDVLDENNSILIDPQNIMEIATAISDLRDNKKKRSRLAAGALKTAERLTIDKRAESILKFISNKIIQ